MPGDATKRSAWSDKAHPSLELLAHLAHVARYAAERRTLRTHVHKNGAHDYPQSLGLKNLEFTAEEARDCGLDASHGYVGHTLARHAVSALNGHFV